MCVVGVSRQRIFIGESELSNLADSRIMFGGGGIIHYQELSCQTFNNNNLGTINLLI